jgi:GNAT superfamily N-acetyltransferase
MDDRQLIIDRRPVTDIDDDLAATLCALTLPDGEMAKVFRACARHGSGWGGIAYVAHRGGEPLGWCLRWQAFRGARWGLHLYVADEHRRTGVATALVGAASARLGRHTAIRGYVWDATSASFWRTQHDPRLTLCDTSGTSDSTAA